MPKTSFVNGTTVSPDFLNAINNITFDGQDLDGHRAKIGNAELSDIAGDIKPEWTTFRDTLKVTAGTGLSANYLGGVVTLPTGSLVTLTPGTIGLTASATNYIYINESGAIAASTIAPIVGLPLAQITTLTGTISGSVIDLRPRFVIAPLPVAIKVFGGTGEEGDYTLTGTGTLDKGYYYFKNFTVQAGAVLTISQFAKIFCSGAVTIAGTINITNLASGGSNFSTSIIGSIGGLSGAGPGGGSGSSAVGGSPYNYAAAPYGSAGASGFINLSSGASASIALGGKGGGGFWIESRGDLNVTGTVNATGQNGSNGVLFSGSGDVSGAGAGSGGLVLLSSLTKVTVSSVATINVSGGNGGNGVAGNGSGGGAGAGGQVVLISPSNNTSGATILLTGGTKGTNAGTGSLGGGNGGGFGGTGGGGGGGGSAATTGQLILRNFRGIGN